MIHPKSKIIAGVAVTVIALTLVMWFAFTESGKIALPFLDKSKGIANDAGTNLALPDEVMEPLVSWKEVRPIGPEDPLWGQAGENALEIIVYLDMADSYSPGLIESLEKAATEFGDKIVIAYRPFFLKNSQESILPALALACGQTEGKTWDMIRAMAKEGQNFQDNEEVLDWAGKMGLNIEGMSECLASPETLKALDNDRLDAMLYGVTGTPTLFVGKEFLAGAYPYDDFKDSSDLEREGLGTVIRKHLQ